MFSLSLPVFHKHTYSHTAHQWGRCDLCELRATHHFPVITGATSNPISIRHMLHKDVCVFVCVCVQCLLPRGCVLAVSIIMCVKVCLKTEIVSVWESMLQGDLAGENVCVCARASVHMSMCPVLNSLSLCRGVLNQLSPDRPAQSWPVLELGNRSTNTRTHTGVLSHT